VAGFSTALLGLPLVLASFFATLHGMESGSLIDTARVEWVRKVAGEAMFEDINFMLPRAGV
jgi:hypothetical protein